MLYFHRNSQRRGFSNARRMRNADKRKDHWRWINIDRWLSLVSNFVNLSGSFKIKWWFFNYRFAMINYAPRNYNKIFLLTFARLNASLQDEFIWKINKKFFNTNAQRFFLGSILFLEVSCFFINSFYFSWCIKRSI